MKQSLIAIMLAGATLAPLGAAHAVSSGPEFTRAGHRLAQCLYTKRKADVIGALGATSADEGRRFDILLRKSTACQNVTVSTAHVEGATVNAPADILRGMLAEAALRQMGRMPALGPIPDSASYQRSWFAATGRDATVDEMAVCTAEVNPAAVRDLLRTMPDSAEELEAAQSLSPTLGPCLPQGATLKANRQSLRAALAEALYHRANAPSVAAK